MNDAKLETFFQLIEQSSNKPGGGRRQQFYMQNQVFKDIDFRGKCVIDIGGGVGRMGFFALLHGAEHVVVIEPECDGSSAGMIEGFNKFKQALGNPDNIELVAELVENYNPGERKFDIVLLHNSINHVDEEACIVLSESKDAQEKYLDFFQHLSNLTAAKSTMIVCDCTNSNFYPTIGLTNPILKTIEWNKHQPPEVWAGLAANTGYKMESVSWTTPNDLRGAGQLLFGNKLAAYFMMGHFRLLLTR